MTDVLEASGKKALVLRDVLRDALSMARLGLWRCGLIIILGALPRMIYLVLDPGTITKFPEQMSGAPMYFARFTLISLPMVVAQSMVIIIALMQARNQRIDYAFAFWHALRRLVIICLGYLWIALPTVIAVMLFIIPALAVFAFSRNTTATLAIGMAFTMIPVAYIAARAAVYLPVAVLENQGAWCSVERSASLTRGYRWKALFILALVAAANWAIDWVAQRIYGSADLGTGFYAHSIASVPLEYIDTMVEMALFLHLRRIEGDPVTTLALA